MDTLPEGLIYAILKQCDPVSCIRMLSICKEMREKFPVKVFLVKRQTFRALKKSYSSLNDLVNDVKKWVDDHVYQEDQLYVSQKIRHLSICPNTELRFTKNEKGRCSFVIQNTSCPGASDYQLTQMIWEPDYNRYRWILLNNMLGSFKINVFMLWVGFQVLMKLHGFVTYKDILMDHDPDAIQPWIHKLLVSGDYNGMLIDSLLDGIVELRH